MSKAICPFPPVMFRSTQSDKVFAGSGTVFVEVPAGTTTRNIGRYVMTKEEKDEAELGALQAYLEEKPGKCPSCLSVGVDVYPNTNGICKCNGCNDLPPTHAIDNEGVAK